MKKILLLAGLLIGLVTVQAQIVNEGILKINPSTTVSFGDNFTNKVGASSVFTNDGILHVTGNFINLATVTTASPTGTSETIFNSTNAASQFIYTDGGTRVTKFHNLTINNNATNGNSLGVEDNVDADAGVNLEVTNTVNIADGQKLRLMGEAQLIQTHTGTAQVTGAGVLLKDQQGAKNSRRYNYWSSPVNTETGGNNYLVHKLKDGTTADPWAPVNIGLVTAGYDGTASPAAVNTYWFWKYTSNAVDPYNYENWIALFASGSSTSSVNMLPGEGYTMKGTDASSSMTAQQNYTFQGKPNDGNYNITLNNGDEYLVGNPYPSALDADKFITENAVTNTRMDGTIYFWHHWSSINHQYVYYGAGYAAYNLSGGNHAVLHGDFTHGPPLPTTQEITPEQFIPVGQGFIIRAETGNGGSIVFNNSQRAFRLEGNNSNQLRTVSRTANSNGVNARIRLLYDDPSEKHRPLLLAFTDGVATNSFDYGYDGQMIDVGGDDLFFTMEDEGRNFPYGIQGIGAYSVDAAYPLTMKISTSGIHKIILTETEDFDHPIYILDNETDMTHDIRANDFTVSMDAGIYENRFELVFKPHQPLEVDNYLNDFVHAYYSDEEVVIKNNKNVSLTGVHVYNAIGQLVYTNTNQTELSADEIRIPFNFAQAAYVMKMQAVEGRGTYKFINY